MGELHTHFAVTLARRSRPSRCHLLGTLTCSESAIRTVTQLTFTPVSKETQAAVAAAFPRSSPPAAGLPPLQSVPSPCTAYVGLFGGAPGILQVRPTFRALCLRPPSPPPQPQGKLGPLIPFSPEQGEARLCLCRCRASLQHTWRRQGQETGPQSPLTLFLNLSGRWLYSLSKSEVPLMFTQEPIGEFEVSNLHHSTEKWFKK